MTESQREERIEYILQFTDYFPFGIEKTVREMDDSELDKMVEKASNIEDSVAIYCESLRY